MSGGVPLGAPQGTSPPVTQPGGICRFCVVFSGHRSALGRAAPLIPTHSRRLRILRRKHCLPWRGRGIQDVVRGSERGNATDAHTKERRVARSSTGQDWIASFSGEA